MIRTTYKLTTRYEITKFTQNFLDNGEADPHSYPNQTGERLSIDDTIDLANAVTLTRVLHMLDRIHETVKEVISDGDS
jgi:hypothetical protein